MRKFLLQKANRNFERQKTVRPPIVRPVETARKFNGFVFVCGLHRSGTTLAEMLLHSHSQVSVLRANVPENEGQHLQDVYPRAIDHGGPGKFAFSPRMHAHPEMAPAQARSRLLKCWTPWVDGYAGVLLEKVHPT